MSERRHDHAGLVGEADGGGAGVSGAIADLTLAIGQMREDMAAPRKAQPRIPWEACHPVPVAIGQNIPLSAGAGTLGVTQDMFGPNDDVWWDLRRLSVWGFSAGTVLVYVNQIGGELLATFPSPGEFTWGLQKLLGPRDSIIWQASGITLAAGSSAVQVGGQAIEIQTAWLPEYAM